MSMQWNGADVGYMEQGGRGVAGGSIREPPAIPPPTTPTTTTTRLRAVGRILVVSHTDSGDTIRIISARRATPRERKFYEKDESNQS
jgi:hypothetical protein